MVFNFFSIVKPEKFREFTFEADKIETLRRFDAEIADKIINIYEIKTAWIGLREDWDATSDLYYENGEVNPQCHAIYESYWASPIIKDEKGREFDCFTTLFRTDDL